MFFGGRKDLDDPEYKSLLTPPKEQPSPPKPSDVRNGDLVSLLLAATPPYLYNMPLVPQTFFFSEMLRSFVQAKTERQNAKTHQIHRRRKRTWRETTPPKNNIDPDKPLELTTSKVLDKPQSPVAKKPTPSCDFTAEKLANSSVVAENTPGAEAPLPVPPMWYPNVYPNQPPYPIDPLHFFIDLRVSAHIWDRKLNAEAPLNLADRVDLKPRTQSAFSLPEKKENCNQKYEKSKLSPHYFMSNLKRIYSTPKEENHKTDKKDLRAVIGLELVVDYVKQESEDEENPDEIEA